MSQHEDCDLRHLAAGLLRVQKAEWPWAHVGTRACTAGNAIFAVQCRIHVAGVQSGLHLG